MALFARKLLRSFLLTIGLVVMSTVCSGAQRSQPRIFYTDLLSGPAHGGEGDQGVFVTLYGTGFGATQGASKVTLGGNPVFAYRQWTDTRITVQIGNAAQSGSIVVHIESLPDSREEPFVVRPGRIYFVSPSGNDRNSGSFSKPWKNLVFAKDSLQPGDTLYVMNGLVQTSLDKYESALSIQTSGRPGRPVAIVAYPGSKAIVGSFTAPRIAARTPNIDRTSNHWVLAGLTFRGDMEALDLTASDDWRIVGNDFSCPNGFGATGCVETGQATHVEFLGNSVHDVAQPGTTKAYHAVYFSTDSNHIEVAWNVIANVRGCRGLQFHSSPLDPGTGRNLYDLNVHDNIIHDVVCDGINFATVDPSKGPVVAYNNLIYNVGTGPDPQDGGANYACIYVQGGANTGPPGSGNVELYNNTLYNCGARGNSDSGGITVSAGSPAQKVILTNNIIVLDDNVPLLSPGSDTHTLTSRGNLIRKRYRSSQKPRGEQETLFQDASKGEFAPRQGSSAQGIGAPANLSSDLRAQLAPQTEP
jgi:hypothetical protein